jgi:hypothetical protein
VGISPSSWWKWAKEDLPAIVLILPEGGDEEQILRAPRDAIGLVGGGAFFHHEVGKDAAEDDDGELLAVELDEEDAPWLLGIERTELADGLDLGGVLRFETEFVGFVIEGEILDAVAFERPAEFVLEVADEMGERADGAEVHKRHKTLRHKTEEKRLLTRLRVCGRCRGGR